MVFQWSLIERKSPQESRDLLINLVEFNNAVIWMISTHRPISNSSISFPFGDHL